MKLKTIKSLAEKNDWALHDYQKGIEMVSFVKVINGDKARVNIYITKMTVATCINHPKKGKTQLFRKNVDRRLMRRIFYRQHGLNIN